MNPFDALPVWGSAALLFVGLIAACEAGSRIHRRHEAADPSEGYLVSAALGLLALLLGFTFNMALSRYDERRELVVAEANAISTAWLRADLLPAPTSVVVRGLLRDYATARLDLAAAGEDSVAVDAADANTDRLQQRIWRTAAPAAVAHDSAPVGNAMVGALTEMFDIAASRHAALGARIPTRVVTVLALYTLISAAILGYAADRRLRHRLATTVLFALLALTCGLILDLDRPRSGAITVSQAPLFDVRKAMSVAVVTPDKRVP